MDRQAGVRSDGDDDVTPTSDQNDTAILTDPSPCWLHGVFAIGSHRRCRGASTTAICLCVVSSIAATGRAKLSRSISPEPRSRAICAAAMAVPRVGQQRFAVRLKPRVAMPRRGNSGQFYTDFIRRRAHGRYDRGASAKRPGLQFNFLTGTRPGVRCALAPKHIGRKEPLMQLPDRGVAQACANLLTALK